MKTTLFTAAIIAALVSAPSLAAGDAAAGKAKAATCAACHGADGNSAASAFPKLAGLGGKYLIKQMKDIKSGDRPVAEMTGMLDNSSEQDIADIAAYYQQQERALSGAQENKKLLSLGENIYRAGNLETGVPACTGCHSPAGNGNAPAGYPALGGQHTQYIAKQLRAFRTAAHDEENQTGRKNDESKVMRSVSAHMNDLEIDALANYISGLH
ncbi:MAG TPA: cytochrome c4 [Porticoccaceae bacterium]|nr:cytochrome c4 [Porticoccaceae bacterium]HCO59176.1 cytochrome c4 [Porticoccaceae bacterium]